MTPCESILCSKNGSSILKQLVLITFFIQKYIYIYIYIYIIILFQGKPTITYKRNRNLEEIIGDKPSPLLYQVLPSFTIIELEPRPPLKKMFFSGQILIKLRL